LDRIRRNGSEGAGPLRDRLAALTLELCSIPSETREEREIADHVEAFCLSLVGRDRVRRIGHSVVCLPAPGDESHPIVALVGHLDTVRCAEDQPTEIRDGRVYGCGASDMKGGVATMMALLESGEAPGPVRPLWIFYDKEEGPQLDSGLEPVLQSGVLPRIDLAIVLEPTDRTIQMGCMGTFHATVTVRGTRAHSARPWQGENAIYRARAVLDRFAALQRREVRIGELSFYEVFVVTRCWTENSANVVPDRVMLNVNVRFAPGRTADEAIAELREIVGEAGEIEITDVAPAGAVHADLPLLEGWRRRAGLPIAPKQAWTDVARFTERGTPAINFGPGETAQAHQAGEWCSIDSLVFVHDHLADFLARSEPRGPSAGTR